MPFRAVFWDLGGVLLRTEDRTPRAQAADHLGLTYEQLEDLVFNSEAGLRAQLGEVSPSELWAFILRSVKLAPEDKPWLYEAFFGGDRMDVELVNFVRSLRPRYKTGLISNAWDDLRPLLVRWKVADAFDTIVISGEAQIMKPDARIYRLALENLGMEAGESIFIDDNPKNVEGARAAGLAAIRFSQRDQALADLDRLLNG
jgi:epoxide hydrolase-like predicted phosphatase